MKNFDLFAHVQRFLLVHLRGGKGLSPNSILSYRDVLRLFFEFVSKAKRKKTHNLSVEDFDASIVLLYLTHIEDTRKNSIRTRNHRLSLLRIFFSYLQMHNPERSEIYSKIFKIPIKKGPKKIKGYLEVDEIGAILRSIDQTTKLGLRDYTLLLLMYNTGARVQEVCDLTKSSFTFDKTPLVRIIGKGNRERIMPIWGKTKSALEYYFAKNPWLDENTKLFFNNKGAPITRHGVLNMVERRVKVTAKTCKTLLKKRVSPHTFRHTTAMHLLQSGVDINVIRIWLDHASVNTTADYIEINIEMKKKALQKKRAPYLKQELDKVLKQDRDIVRWLNQFRN
jgi:site-specific recombinase XerD